MATREEHALLSLYVYKVGNELINRPLLPTGWERLEYHPDNLVGFSYGVFRRIGSNEIVIAYTGTNEQMIADWALANIPAGAGLGSVQVTQAALAYQQARAAYGNNITLTGHSLGAGLASIVAVWFDRPAVIFDAAPFELTARNPIYVAASRLGLSLAGYSDPAFDAYSPVTNFTTREAAVSAYYLQGEILSALRTPLTTIQGNADSAAVVRVGFNDFLGAGGITLHSQALLTATLMSDAFRASTLLSQRVLPRVMDERLYANNASFSSDRNFLIDLIRSEQGNAGSGKLSRFAADLNRLGANVSGLSVAAQDALIAQAIEWYYWQGSGYAGQEFFVNGQPAQPGLLQYTTAQGTGLPGAQDRAGSYVNAWLTPIVNDHGEFYSSRFASAAQWSVSTGAAVTATARDAGKTQMFIGQDAADTFTGGDAQDMFLAGAGADTLSGGSGNDQLFGGAGDDNLDGGADDDTLMGGADTDTYRFNSAGGASFGSDTVVDSDGRGQLTVDGYGQVTTDQIERLSENTWRTTDDKVYFTRRVVDANRTDLTIRVATASSTGVITVQNWHDGNLGLNLGGEVQLSNVHVLGGGNDAGVGPDVPAATTVMRTGAGHDAITWHSSVVDATSFLYGEDGNDLLFGGGQDDVIDGGAGNDLISGLRGRDVISGGAGNDLIAQQYAYVVIQALDPGEVWAQEGGLWAWNFHEDRPVGDRLWWSQDFNDYTTLFNLTTTGAHSFTLWGDTLAETGGDTVFAGAGDDLVAGCDGSDLLSGDDGDDVLLGYAGNDTVAGGLGRDELSGGAGDDRLEAGDGDDTVFGGHGADVIDGGTGNDTLEGDFGLLDTTHQYPLELDLALMGSDYIDGKEGSDSIVGGGGGDTLYGGDGMDTIAGDAGIDLNRPASHDGNDWIDGGADNDQLTGDGGNDTLLGGTGADSMVGDEADEDLNGVPAGHDYLDGQAGNDTLAGDGGNDTLFGGSEDDTLLGDNAHVLVNGASHGRDFLSGDAGNDELVGNGSHDTLLGGAGNDYLDGDSPTTDLPGEFHGNDLLDGGDGNDALYGSGGADTLVGGEGADVLMGDNDSSAVDAAFHGNDVLDGGGGNDTLFGGGGADVISGGDGDDWLAGEDERSANAVSPLTGADILDGGRGNDALIGGNGDDVLAGGDGADSLYGGNGNDNVSGDLGADGLDGGNGDDSLSGGEGNDLLFGSAGNDTLVGGAGNDLLSGGDGDDTYSFGRDAGFDVIQGSAGTDRVLLADGVLPSQVTLWRNADHLQLVIDGSPTQLQVQGFFSGASDEIERIEFADGTVWNTADILARTTSGTQSTYISIYGVVESIPIDFTTDSVQGPTTPDGDTAYASVNYTLPAGVSNLRGTGYLNINLIGNASNNIIEGNAGENILQGGDGADTYIVQNTGDVVGDSSQAPPVDYAGTILWDQADRLETTVSYTLPATVETIAAIGDQAITLTGNSLSNRLIGDTNPAANDLRGGAGNDVYVLGDGDTPIEAPGEGYDDIGNYTTQASTFVMWDNVEKGFIRNYLTGEALNVVGNAGDNWLAVQTTGSFGLPTETAGGSDTIRGGAGNDQLHGLSRNTTYLYDLGDGRDTVYEYDLTLSSGQAGDRILFGAGITQADVQIQRQGADLWIGVGGAGDGILLNEFAQGYQRGPLEYLQFADGSIIDLLPWLPGVSGSAADDTFIGGAGGDLFYGLAGNDNLSGLGGNDALNGGDGHDTLNGGTGSDTLVGGSGNDTFVVDSAADVVVERVGEGSDTVQSSVAWTLAADFENLTLTGTAAINGTGNAMNNVLTGNSAANVLTGGAGNDTYIVGTGDSVVELGGEGTDLVQSSATFTLGSEIENLTLTGGSAINGTGNAQSNVLTGNSAANVLTGGAGDDTYVVGTGDSTIEAASGGNDTVQAAVTWTLAAEVENLVLTGTGAVDGTGNGLANSITGNSAANALNGGGGIDTLIGGGGNDTYTVDNSADVVTELANEGTDSVNASATYTLGANVENLTLTGTSAINGTGNGLDNVLTGNSAANVLTGGAGNDIYVVGTGDTVTEQIGGGVDTVQASITWSIASAANVENLTLTGASVINGTGNTLDNVLTGNSAANSLTGGAGNDTLDGGAGNDTMIGGTGNDTYVVNVSTDVITENANEGIDTVQSSVALTLTNTNLENLTLLGTSAINGTGNANANVLTGNSAANTLSGLDGNDTYIGGGGNDALNDTSTTSNDIYRWGIGQGNDTITDAGGTADRIEIGAGVASSQVVLTRSGNNLQVSITGASDVLTVANWYVGTANRIEEIRLADGSVINTGTAAPASLVAGAGTLETLQMRRTRLPVSLGRAFVGPVSDPDSVRSVQLLSQAMAQFIAGAETTRDTGWIVRRPEPVRVDLAAY